MWLFLLSVAFVVCLAIRYGLPYIGVWEKNIADTGAEGWDRWVEPGGLGGERVWVKGAREGYGLVLGGLVASMGGYRSRSLLPRRLRGVHMSGTLCTSPPSPYGAFRC